MMCQTCKRDDRNDGASPWTHCDCGASWVHPGAEAALAPRRHEKGNWSVMRNCCTSGNCFECRFVTPLGWPTQIVQGTGYSERYAKIVASNWSRYKAIAKEGL